MSSKDAAKGRPEGRLARRRRRIPRRHSLGRATGRREQPSQQNRDTVAIIAARSRSCQPAIWIVDIY